MVDIAVCAFLAKSFTATSRTQPAREHPIVGGAQWAGGRGFRRK